MTYFAKDYDIQLIRSTPFYAEANGQLEASNNVTPRPKKVYSTCNRRGAYVHQKTFLII